MSNGYELSADVARLVTEDVLAGTPISNTSEYRTKLDDVEIDLDGLALLQKEAIEGFEAGDMECDAWLAPRLHCFLRLTRRQAHNQGLWRWLALDHMSPYVWHRWMRSDEGGEKVKAYRFLGTSFGRRNAIARLWWSAETMRNGSDYREVATVMGNSASALDQYILDLRYSYSRASALALVRVCTNRHPGVPKMTFDQIKSFSKRVNLLLSATSLESIAPPEEDELGAIDTAWLAEEPVAEVIVKQKLEDLRGPKDGVISEDEILNYARWYAEVALQVIGK